MDTQTYTDIETKLKRRVANEPLKMRSLTAEEISDIEKRTSAKREKVLVDQVRHLCTRYDQILQMINNQSLASTPDESFVLDNIRTDLKRALSRRVLKEIGKRHPELNDECVRQLNHSWMHDRPERCRLNFGRFKNVPICDVPYSYLLTLLKRQNTGMRLKALIFEFLHSQLMLNENTKDVA